jgi:hypothetical protein
MKNTIQHAELVLVADHLVNSPTSKGINADANLS